MSTLGSTETSEAFSQMTALERQADIEGLRSVGNQTFYFFLIRTRSLMALRASLLVGLSIVGEQQDVRVPQPAAVICSTGCLAFAAE